MRNKMLEQSAHLNQSLPIEIKAQPRELNEDRLARILDALKGDGFVYNTTGVISFTASLISQGGTKLGTYIESLDNESLTHSCLGDSSLIDLLIASRFSPDSDRSKVTVDEFKNLISILFLKYVGFSEASYIKANENKIDLIQLYVQAHVGDIQNVTAQNIVDAFDRATESKDLDILKYGLTMALSAYYKFEATATNDLILPKLGKVQLDIFAIAKEALVYKNNKLLADIEKDLELQGSACTAAKDAKEHALKEWQSATSLFEREDKKYKVMSLNKLQCQIKGHENICMSIITQVNSLSTTLIKKRAEANTLQEEVSNLEHKHKKLSFSLDESRMDVSEVNNVLEAANIFAQTNYTTMEEKRALLKDIFTEIQTIKQLTQHYKQEFDINVSQIQTLQLKLPDPDKKMALLLQSEMDKVLESRYGSIKSSIENFFNGSYANYSLASFKFGDFALSVATRRPEIALDCMSKGIDIGKYVDPSSCNYLHILLRDCTARTGLSENFLMFVLLFDTEALTAKNKAGKSPLDVASQYLQEQPCYLNMVAELKSNVQDGHHQSL